MAIAINRVLVANRGEIARRVFATCRRRGISTVAVHSDADDGAAFVGEADLAVRLPGNSPSDSYLRADLIIEAAKRSGADAVHPGYGFLSENAEFARAVAAAGLVWIGPDPESIEQMGSKIESKRLMRQAGVPVLGELDPATITEADLPVLVKAASGGGGRGMRVVNKLEDLAETVASASREAASAFGDETVFCERYLPDGHHIEVQVFGDRHGTVWAVGERECSIQRRHQKVVEEAPSPLVERIGPSMRERLYEAARSAAERIGYVGAGTVEFLADDQGDFFFLEMNTRLQVEHPVTECTTGLDLVGLQLDVASGLPLTGQPPTASGSAIEVRLYAEDPAEGWRPQSGPVHEFSVPAADTAFAVLNTAASAVRLDAGLEAGETIGSHYDPMIAKVIGVGPSREVAARGLAQALERMRWIGPRTNADLLVRVLRDPGFLAGETTTAFFDEHPEVFLPLLTAKEVRACAIAAAVASAELIAQGAPVGPSDLPAIGPPRSGEDALAAAIGAANPRPRIGGWRLFHPDWRARSFTSSDGEHRIEYRCLRDRWELSPATLSLNPEIEIIAVQTGEVRLSIAGVETRYRVTRSGANALVESPHASIVLAELPRYTDPSALVTPGSLLSPIPGAVIRVGAEAGDTVTAGQPIIWLEAMKMEHAVMAPAPGVLEELRVAVGDQVDVGMLLAVIAEPDAPEKDGTEKESS